MAGLLSAINEIIYLKVLYRWKILFIDEVIFSKTGK